MRNDPFGNPLDGAAKAGNAVEQSVSNVSRGVERAGDGLSDSVKRSGDLVEKSMQTGWNLTDKVFGAAKDVMGVFESQPFGGSDLVVEEPSQLPGNPESGDGAPTSIPALSRDAKETMPSLDPLKREVSEPFNAVNKKMQDAKGYLFGTGGLVDSLRDGFFNLRDGAFNAVGLDYKDVVARAEMAMKAARSIAALPGEVQREFNNLIQEAEAIRREVEGTINVFVDGVKYEFDSMNDYIGFLKVQDSMGRWYDRDIAWGDYETTAALTNSVADTLAAYGVPEQVDKMVEKQDPAVQQLLWEELVIRSSANGDLVATEHYATKLKAERKPFLSRAVSINLLRNLNNVKDASDRDVGKRLLTLLTSFSAKWDESLVQRGRIELLYYTILSSAALMALLTTEKRPYACAYGNVYYENSNSLIERYFPV